MSTDLQISGMPKNIAVFAVFYFKYYLFKCQYVLSSNCAPKIICNHQSNIFTCVFQELLCASQAPLHKHMGSQHQPTD